MAQAVWLLLTREGRLALSSWRGLQSISELEKPAAARPGLSQPDAVNEPVNLPACQRDVPGERRRPGGRAHGRCHAPGRGVNRNGLTSPPKRAVVFCYDFASFFSPGKMTSCTSAHRCKGEGEGRVRDGAGEEGSRPLPAAAGGLTLGTGLRETHTHLAPAAPGWKVLLSWKVLVGSSVINQFV